MIERSCRVLIRREERFAKTAVGWVLLDVSKHDRAFTRWLLEEDLKFHSKESMKNAMKQLGEVERRAIDRPRKGA